MNDWVEHVQQLAGLAVWARLDRKEQVPAAVRALPLLSWLGSCGRHRDSVGPPFAYLLLRPESAPALEEGLSSPDVAVRGECLRLVFEGAPHRRAEVLGPRPLLLSGATSSDERTRRLARVLVERWLTRLNRAFGDPTPEQRAAAEEALARAEGGIEARVLSRVGEVLRLG